MKARYDISQMYETLPLYVPHVLNGYGRDQPLNVPYVALTTFDIAPPLGERFASGEDLRRAFGVSSDTKLISLSIGKDPKLEHHWHYSEFVRISEYLAQLGISHITAPNFSFSLSEPRPEHLVNRSRSLVEAERFSRAGLSVIPHINAFTLRDWELWTKFLQDHPHLNMLSQEFQTGLANHRLAGYHIQQIQRMEQSIGRGIHLLAVGGRRHLKLLRGLANVTIIDTNPFIKAMKRFAFEQNRWVKGIADTPREMDQLLASNVGAYSKYVTLLDSFAQDFTPRKEPHRETVETSIDSCQLELFPLRRLA